MLRQLKSPSGAKFIVNSDFTLQYVPPKVRTIATHNQDIAFFFDVVRGATEHLVSPIGQAKFTDDFIREHNEAIIEHNLAAWAWSKGEMKESNLVEVLH